MTIPVLLIHGFGSSFETGWQRHGWTDLLEDEGRHVIAYDLPGHGRRKNAEPHEFKDIGTLLLKDVKEHGLLDIVGFSAGTRVAISMASLRPDLVRKLVLIAPSDSFVAPVDNTELVETILGQRTPRDAAHATLARLAHAPENSVEGLVTFLRHANEPITPDMLACVTTPTLVVTGSRDLKGNAPELRAALSNVHHIEIAGCDHFNLPTDARTIHSVLTFLIAA